MRKGLYQARGVHQLPSKVAGPLLEYSIGTYSTFGDAYFCVDWWRTLRSGVQSKRGDAYVLELAGVAVQARAFAEEAGSHA